MPFDDSSTLRAHLLAGQVIPAHPLALTSERKLDERRQRALTRYNVAAGAGGVAVGVHTTQFAIRDHGLYEPVLALAAETADRVLTDTPFAFVKVAGVIGKSRQALREAETARQLGYDCALVSLGGSKDAKEEALIDHCRAVAETMPLFGFYLQPAVGGRALGYSFWRALAEIPGLVAIKIAPFDRYATLDVVRAVADAGRDDVALYTGNDDSIVADLVTPYRVATSRGLVERRIVGGLLGQWAVWTRRAVQLLEDVKLARGVALDPMWLTRAAALTDANGAIFDAAHRFAGCIPGIHEILRRQGLLENTLTLDPAETLSPGQLAEIDRVCRGYPELVDDEFVQERLDDWLS